MNTITRRQMLHAAIATGAAVTVLRSESTAAASRRVIEIAARPGPFMLDTQSTAVIVVDMQNDFGSPGGMLHRAGIDITGVQRAVAPMARTLAAVRRAGMPIIYFKMGYLPDLSDLGGDGSVNRTRHLALGVGRHMQAPDGRNSRILVRDTWNTDIVAGLEPQAKDTVLYKTRFSGFYGTGLHERLSGMGIRQLIVIGCTTSNCVESTVRDAMFRDYRCLLLEDCTSEPVLGSGNHAASLLTIEKMLGWVSDSGKLAGALA